MPLLTTASFVKLASAGKVIVSVLHIGRKIWKGVTDKGEDGSLLGIALQELNAISSNIHASDLEKFIDGRESAERLTANHHIVAFTGFVIAKLIEEYAALPENGDLAPDLIALAKVFPEKWLAAATRDTHGIPPQQARSFLEDLRSTLQGKQVAVDEKELSAQIAHILRDEELLDLLPAPTRDKLAAVIAKVLPDALANALVHEHPICEAAFKKASLRFQNEVLNKLDKIHDTVAAGFKQTDKKLDELLLRTPLNQYLRNLTARFSKHNSIGIPAVEDTKQKQGPDSIAKLFVQPTCTTERLRPEDLPAALLDAKKKPTPLLARLVAEKRVVMLADPGMGKSTLIQWLVVTLANTAVPSPEAIALGRGIPLPFILRDIIPLMPPKLEDWTWMALVHCFLNHRLDDKPHSGMAYPLTADDDTLRDVMQSPHAWFMIDGLDEVGDKAKRTALRNVIWQGFEAHKEARFLITSRVVGYEEAEVHDKPVPPIAGTIDPSHRRRLPPHLLSLEQSISRRGVQMVHLSRSSAGERVFADIHMANEFGDVIASGQAFHEMQATCLYLAPWDDPQQSAFSDHWFHLRLGDHDGPIRAREFVRAVHDHPSTRSIGRVPNLLLLMALLYRYRADLPHGRAKVYAGISQAYLENIAKVSRIDHRSGTAVPYTFAQKERLLAIIAMHMQLRRTAEDGKKKPNGEQPDSEILASKDDLHRWLCPEFGQATDAANQQEMEKFISHIADSSGLLLPRGVVDGQEQFAFAHLSFQEYYAACWLELEFSRLLNLNTGEDDLLAAPAPAPDALLALTDKLFAQRAATTLWREPLLFLAEKLAERPADTTTLRKWLFPIRKGETLPMPAQELLATFSIDPQVSFTPDQRHAIWEHLCRAHLANEEPWKTDVAPSLLVPSDYQPTILSLLVSLAAETQETLLWLSGCTGVSDLAALKGLGSLEWLYLSGCTRVSDLAALKDLGSLHYLYLNGCTGVSDLAALKDLRSLHWLDLTGCTRVSDLAALNHLGSLKDLYLTGCTGVSDFAALKDLRSLQILSLEDCTGVSDLAALKGSGSLRSLFLSGCTGVSDLAALKDLRSLQGLGISGCTGVKDWGRQMAELKKALPECQIISS